MRATLLLLPQTGGPLWQIRSVRQGGPCCLEDLLRIGGPPETARVLSGSLPAARTIVCYIQACACATPTMVKDRLACSGFYAEEKIAPLQNRLEFTQGESQANISQLCLHLPN